MADIGVLRAELSGIDGLHGTLNGAVGAVYEEHDIYDGPIVVTPKTDSETVLETANTLLINDITVLEVPYFETTNLSGGYTVYIGGN